MNYKSHLLANYDKLYKVKNMLETLDTNYFTRTVINEKSTDNNTISIVMTTCNRSSQTYYTLTTIKNSVHKNVQVIIIDDSSFDPVIIENLKSYDLHIELINIKNKFWVNPCVNYNIGFKYVSGGKIIIQNAEVCHFKGDILNYVNNVVKDEEYHSFDVYALDNIEENNKLYTADDIHNLRGMWYQHPVHRNLYYHFLVAMTMTTFNKIKGFDIDYAIGIDYDDNALVHRIKNNNIKMINVQNSCLGVHQWHPQTNCGSHSRNMNNEHLFNIKNNYYNQHRIFLDLTTFPEDAVANVINFLF